MDELNNEMAQECPMDLSSRLLARRMQPLVIMPTNRKAFNSVEKLSNAILPT